MENTVTMLLCDYELLVKHKREAKGRLPVMTIRGRYDIDDRYIIYEKDEAIEKLTELLEQHKQEIGQLHKKNSFSFPGS